MCPIQTICTIYILVKKLMNSYRLIAMHAHLVSESLEPRSSLRIILLRADVVC